MTPENHQRAATLEIQHRGLQDELRRIKLLHEPPQMLVDRPQSLPSAGIPQEAWLVFRAKWVAHVEAAVKANRKAFEAL